MKENVEKTSLFDWIWQLKLGVLVKFIMQP